MTDTIWVCGECKQSWSEKHEQGHGKYEFHSMRDQIPVFSLTPCKGLISELEAKFLIATTMLLKPTEMLFLKSKN